MFPSLSPWIVTSWSFLVS
uniref:Uncharacterized protein n=1 Tax=Rhizophora mucronata TaxID=61149 RepID=A0A2P2NIE3_RHIMU